MPKREPAELLTLKDILSEVPIKERTLRQVISELGYRHPRGRRLLLFTREQVEHIKSELVSIKVETPLQRDKELARRQGISVRALRRRQTAAWLAEFRAQWARENEERKEKRRQRARLRQSSAAATEQTQQDN